MDKAEIRRLAEKFEKDVMEFRHRLHRIPELAGTEVRTAAEIRGELRSLPLEILDPFLGTDTVCLIRGAHPGRNITLRADIDALPIEEKDVSLPYRSVHPGRMHACGHDAHCAMLLGAARILCEMREQLHGTVRLVFQPGEELAAMGEQMVNAGVLNGPEADFVAALHVYPGIKTGVVAGRAGAIFPGGGSVEITLKRTVTNSVVFSDSWTDMNQIAAELILFLKQNWPQGSRIRFSRMQSSGVSPYIPDTVKVFAPLSSERYDADDKIRALVEEAKKKYAGVEMEMTIDYQLPYPPTINREEDYGFAAASAVDSLGRENFMALDAPGFGSEDFSFFLRKKPGVYFFIGNGSGIWLHEDRFNADDALLKNGMIFLAGLAWDFLRKA